MDTRDSQISATEFLSKNLIVAGVLLSIPAVISAAVATLMLRGARLHDAWLYLGWIAFCAVGLFLLIQSIRVVRRSSRFRNPRLVWVSVSAYLAIIVIGGAIPLCSAYRLAQRGELIDWHGDEMSADVLVLPACLLLLPSFDDTRASTPMRLTSRCSEPRDSVTSMPFVFAIHFSCFMDSCTGLAVADLVSR
jgi:hypothetical protein